MRSHGFNEKHRLTLYLHARPHFEKQTYINFLFRLETTPETSFDLLCTYIRNHTLKIKPTLTLYIHANPRYKQET